MRSSTAASPSSAPSRRSSRRSTSATASGGASSTRSTSASSPTSPTNSKRYVARAHAHPAARRRAPPRRGRGERAPRRAGAAGPGRRGTYSPLTQALERDVADTQQQLEQLGLEHAQLEAERRELARAQAQLETSIDDWDAPRGSSTPELQAQLDALDAQVAEREAALATQLASYAADAQALERERAAYEAQRTRIAALYAKQGRSAHFASEEARDAALRAELAELEQEDAALAAAARDTAAALDAARTQHAEHVRAREDHEQRTAAAAAATHDAHEAWRALQARREALLEQKKSAWRKETHCTAQLTHARDQLSAAQRLLAGTMDRATAAGLQSVEAIVARERLTGVHGPLYQLFDVDERYATAVEATAGAALFHVVVDTDDTAAQLLRHLHDQKTGRVTFMPLNRLRPADTQYPQAPDAVVMLRKLQFADALLPAFKQVFGKTIICPRLDIAAAYVRSHAGLNAITLDGDQVDRRGALSGGFVDPGRSRLDAIKAVRRWLAELDAAETQLRELRAHTTQLEQDATALHTDMLAKEAARTKEQDARALAADELTWLRRSEADAAARVARLERLAADRAVEAAALATRRDALAAEIGTPLDARLAPDEATELRALVAAEGDAAARIAEHGRAVVAQAEALERLRSELDEHLRRTRDALVQRLERRATQPSDQAAAALATHVDANKARLTQLQAQQDALGARLTQLYAQQAAAVAGDDVDSDAQRQHARTERFAARHQRLLEQRTRCNERIRDLGIVPDDAFQAHQKHSTEQLAHELSAVRAALAQVAHVNKRAVEQLDSFSQQRNSLRQRHDDLKASHAAILELVDVLDARKDEALRTTGAQVAAHFQRLFQRLVPHGRAELQLSERGAALRVAFHRQRASMPIAQLSGGQKALVALALVLAMQACDPAPFYLFDEIDANLDTQHRTAVANLLSSIDGAQLIATTFRPELVERADRHYGVVFSAQKVSTIVDISMADAHDFVEAADST